MVVNTLGSRVACSSVPSFTLDHMRRFTAANANVFTQDARVHVQDGEGACAAQNGWLGCLELCPRSTEQETMHNAGGYRRN